MKSMIKWIRTNLHVNQGEFGQMLGVSSITVNRWENGKAMPNLIAQKQIYEVCKVHKINLTSYIVSSIYDKNNDQLNDEGDHKNKVIACYHASRAGIEGKISPISRSRCDFGKGFYMGTDPLQPLTLVCNEEKPVFYTMELDTDNLACLEIDIGLDWAMLIAYFRGYLDKARNSFIYHKYEHMADGYDVIIGYIANDRMYRVLTDFFEERITDQALLGSLSALNLGRQYVAVTQKACNQIRIIEEKPLSNLELMSLRDISTIRRDEGVAIANRVMREHRRDGRFFDEILEGVEN